MAWDISSITVCVQPEATEVQVQSVAFYFLVSNGGLLIAAESVLNGVFGKTCNCSGNLHSPCFVSCHPTSSGQHSARPHSILNSGMKLLLRTALIDITAPP